MRNFQRGNRNNYGSNFSRGERRNNQDSRFDSNNDSYKRPGNRGTNRNFGDRDRKSRHGYESRNSYQDRRDSHGDNRGNFRSYQERSFKDQKFERSYRNQTPPRSRDRGSWHGDARDNRSSNIRMRQHSPPSTSSFRVQNDFGSRPRSNRGRMTSHRGMRTAGSRMLNRVDLRSSLISKNRSKEYIRKIRQARLKLSDSGRRKASEEEKSPSKETSKEQKQNDNDEDCLDVANDVNFEEDEDDATTKNEESEKSSKHQKEDEGKDSPEMSKENGDSSPEKSKTKRDNSSKSPSKDRSLSIDLNCIHCFTKCSSIQDYRNHLSRRTHLMAMKKLATRVKLTLNRFRKYQRSRQFYVEARMKNVENIPSKYCQICKLYYRQSKIEHRDSDDHKKIRNFLRPFCKICHVQLLSSMKYEIHRCTVEHLKRKAEKNEASDEEIDFQDFDPEDFKTVDSIGDVDGEEVGSTIDEQEYDASIAVGQDFVTKVEVNYCSLCREYLSRSSKDEKVITDHCKSKKHLKWYYQSKKKDEKESESKRDSAEPSKDDEGKDSPQNGDKQQEIHEKEIKKEKENAESVEPSNEDKNSDGKDEEKPGPSKKFKRYFDVEN